MIWDLGTSFGDDFWPGITIILQMVTGFSGSKGADTGGGLEGHESKKPYKLQPLRKSLPQFEPQLEVIPSDPK